MLEDNLGGDGTDFPGVELHAATRHWQFREALNKSLLDFYIAPFFNPALAGL